MVREILVINKLWGVILEAGVNRPEEVLDLSSVSNQLCHLGQVTYRLWASDVLNWKMG